MNGVFSIASFNLHNYNYDAYKDVSGDDVAFKREKLDQIVKIITDGGYDIIALQEIQTPQTVRSIVGGLNEGRSSGGYDFVHCQSFYEKISDDRFKSPEREKRGELAFIWNTRTVELFNECAVYQRLNDRLWLALDYFVQGASATVAGLLGIGGILPSEDSDDKSTRMRRQLKKGVSNKSLKLGGATGVAAAGYVAHRYLDAQLKRMRPPFVAFFHKKNGREVDRSKQLRVINCHSQFGPSSYDKENVWSPKTEAKIQDQEAKFVLCEAFRIAKEPIEQEGGKKPSLVVVLAAGDFNRSGERLTTIVNECVNSKLRTEDKIKIGIVKNVLSPEAHLTTISEKKRTDENAPVEYQYANSYDHFAFDMDVWRQQDAHRIFGLSDERFFILEGKDRCAISDHLPITIKTSDF